MKTTLIYPPYAPLMFGKDKSYIISMPLGLPYLSAYLKSKGHESMVIDLNMKMYRFSSKDNEELWDTNHRYLWEKRELFEKKIVPRFKYSMGKWVDFILRTKPDIVGFYMSYSSQFMVYYLAKMLREARKDLIIIFGGPSCFRENIKEIFKEACDIIVYGEGEITLEEIVSKFKKTGKIQVCKGAFFKIGDKIIYSGERELIKDLDSLPYPDFTDIMPDYRAVWGERVWLSTSWIRGCINKCAFCFESRYWKYARTRSPESIANELICQKKKYNVIGFNKGDSVLTSSGKLLSDICDALIEKNANVLWSSQARPEKYLTLPLLQKMYKAGCRSLSYGIESGSQKVINMMGKNFNLKTAEEVLDNTFRAGINTSTTLMVDAPRETLWDFLKTAWLMIKHRKFITIYNVSTAGVTPMTDWELNPSKYGIILNPYLKMISYYKWHTRFFQNNAFIGNLKLKTLEFLKSLIKK